MRVKTTPKNDCSKDRLYQAGRIAVVPLLLCSCFGGSMVGPTPVPAQHSPNVEFYGARGDDQLDDTSAFRTALASLSVSGGVLTIPAGTYYLRPSPGIDNIDRGLDLSSQANVTIVGAGMDQTTLRMLPGHYSGDTHILLMDRSRGITVRDLTLDGNVSAATYSDEQSHGVEIRSGSNIRFERVRITRTHGDGIRLLGLAKGGYSWVEQIAVVDCRFENTGRSGIGVQRGVKGVTITGSSFTKVSDQAVSMEPTGRHPDVAPRDFLVARNRFYDTGPIAIAIVGVSSRDPAHAIIVTGNSLEQTSILVVNGEDVHIVDNVLAGSNRSPIRIQKASRNIWIEGNEINDESAFHTENASVVVSYDRPFAPTDIYFVGNTVLSGRFIGFYARDSERLHIKGNDFRGTGPSAIFLEDVMAGSPLTSFNVEQNQITGYSVAVSIHSRGDALSRVCVFNNRLEEIGAPLRMTGPVTVLCSGN